MVVDVTKLVKVDLGFESPCEVGCAVGCCCCDVGCCDEGSAAVLDGSACVGVSEGGEVGVAVDEGGEEEDGSVLLELAGGEVEAEAGEELAGVEAGVVAPPVDELLLPVSDALAARSARRPRWK